MERSPANYALRYGALAAGVANYNLIKTTILDHRWGSHVSINIPEVPLVGIRAAGGFLTDTKRWAATHRVHHSTSDANLVPFVELADLMDTGLADDIWPSQLYGMDPAVDAFDTDAAYEIGHHARELVDGLYQPKKEYAARDVNRILFGKNPRYFYESSEEIKAAIKAGPLDFDPDNLPSLQEIRFLLRDPHSPALHREGVPGILKNNVSLYGFTETNFRQEAFVHEDLLPDDLDTWISENRASLRWAYVAAMVAAGVALGPKDSLPKVAAGAVAGAATSGLAVVALLSGGNVTNAFGHAGDFKMRDVLTRDFHNGVVKPKANGTYTTNNKALSPTTLDEVGGQEPHHIHPDYIAYTEKSGMEGFKEAPFGSTLLALARRGIFFSIGNGFGNARRPDVASDAVLLLEDYRARHLAKRRAA